MRLKTEHNITQRELRARQWRAALRDLIALTIQHAGQERDRATQRRQMRDALYLLGLWNE